MCDPSPEASSRSASARPRPGARAAALALLARRDLSEDEVRERLGRREYAESEAEDAVRRLRELGYLDDPALAASLARNRAAGRLHGPQQIAAYLRRRRLPAAVVRSAVEEAFAGGAEIELAKQAAARLTRSKRRSSTARRTGPEPGGEPDPSTRPNPWERRREERKERDRLLRRLHGRGFTREAALAALPAAAGGETDGHDAFPDPPGVEAPSP